MAIGDLHVCVTNLRGIDFEQRLWHTIRSANEQWEPFGDVQDEAGDKGPVGNMSAARIGTDLHVCALGGGLWHTIRFANGRWLGFGDVESKAGDRGALLAVAVA